MRAILGLWLHRLRTPPAAFGGRAEAFPTKPARIVVPFGPAVADVTVPGSSPRSQRADGSSRWSRKPGAGGFAAAQAVTQAKGRRHAVLVSNWNGGSAHRRPKSLPFDPVRIRAGKTLATRSRSSSRRRQDPRRCRSGRARARRARSSTSARSNRSTQHLAAELFKSETGTDLTIVPYRAARRRRGAESEGRAARVRNPAAGSLPHIKNGWDEVLVVTGEQRSPGLPNVPTAAESGSKDYKVTSWNGLAIPPVHRPRSWKRASTRRSTPSWRCPM